MEYEFTLTGLQPLLMHMDDVLQADELDEWRKSPKHKSVSVPGDDRSPAWTWQNYSYHDGEHLTVPSQNLMVALRTAGAKMTFKRGATFKSLTQSGLLIRDEHLEFRNDGQLIPFAQLQAIRDEPFKVQFEKVKEMGFSLMVKRAKVGTAKHVRVRARFDFWTVAGVIEAIDPALTEEVVTQLFELAGKYAGLLDWRPSSPKAPGPYGTFTTQVKALKSKRKVA